MRKRNGGLALLLMSIILTASCGSAGTGEAQTVILVSAASSLKESLEPIENMFENEHPEIDIQFNYGSSGTLQKQIEQGAPADLFLSAGTKQMAALAGKNLIAGNKEVLANRLVLILHVDFPEPSDELQFLLDPSVKKIAVGQPDTVPAGSYAKQALTALGLWDKLESKLVFAQDVRQVLTFVETGNADAGLVYRTDAVTSGKVKTASANIPASSHEPIVYPFGIVEATNNPEEAQLFFDYLVSEPSMNVFRKQGFVQP